MGIFSHREFSGNKVLCVAGRNAKNLLVGENKYAAKENTGNTGHAGSVRGERQSFYFLVVIS